VEVKALGGAWAGDEPSRERLLEREFGIGWQAELGKRQLDLALMRGVRVEIHGKEYGISMVGRGLRISENIRVRATEKAQVEKFVQCRVVAPEPVKDRDIFLDV